LPPQLLLRRLNCTAAPTSPTSPLEKKSSGMNMSGSSPDNLAEETRINHPQPVEQTHHAQVGGDSSLAPVQWEAWSLPTETWGHYESATDLAGGSCSAPLLEVVADPTSAGDTEGGHAGETLRKGQDDDTDIASTASPPKPPILANMGRRMASLPNLAGGGRVGTPPRRNAHKDTTKLATTTASKPSTTSTTSTPTTTATTTKTSSSIEQLQIRTLQSEIVRLQSQLRNLQTTHERTAKSSARHQSKCAVLQTQLGEARSENVLLKQEVADLRTLAKLEEDARWMGALDALMLEEVRSTPTPPAEVEVEVELEVPVEVPVPSSLANTKDSDAGVRAPRRRSLGAAMELAGGGLERHDFTNRVA